MKQLENSFLDEVMLGYVRFHTRRGLSTAIIFQSNAQISAHNATVFEIRHLSEPHEENPMRFESRITVFVEPAALNCA
jgi:hypothetical protein